MFIGSEALSRGEVTPYQLRARFRRVFPDVYGPDGAQLSVSDLACGAWLWSRRRAVLSGVTASALHGAAWVDDRLPIEVNYPNNKTPPGIVSHNNTLHADEIQTRRTLPVTTVPRTAFDLARHGTVGQAVARLDALANATGFPVDDVLELAARHHNLRGVRRVRQVLDLVDAGAQSPKETWLRLLYLDAGFPRPRTQIPVQGPDNRPKYFLDMGWEEVMVAAEYDGEHHRVDRFTYTNDIRRSEYLGALGWRVIRVVVGNRRPEIIERTRRAWASSQNSAR